MTSRLARFLSIVVLALLLVVWALVLRPSSLGGPVTYVVVRGSSMLPIYATGDLVIVRSAPEYRVGEVVAYRVPAGQVGAGLVVIHRIVGASSDGYIVRGDNNNVADPWQPRARDILGTAWVSMPGLGRILAAIHQPVLLAALAAAVVVAMVLAWKPRPGTAEQGLPSG